MDLPLRLAAELERRQAANPRYSLRAFAAWLGIHHSSLSQILRRKRRLTAKTVYHLGKRLSIPPAEICEAVRRENCAAILKVVSGPRFKPDTRWISMMSGLSMDDVNVGLHELLLSRRIEMQSTKTWKKLR